MTFLEEWADYEGRNRDANEAYARRGCPRCRDLNPNQPNAEGQVCSTCRKNGLIAITGGKA